MARPSSYRPTFPEQARKLCLLGATDVEIADFFGITVRGLYKWKTLYPELVHALKQGKLEADSRVEESLYHRAVGYSHDTEKIFNNNGKIVRAPYREHYPPDTTAAIFWLKNRQPQAWRDRHEIAHTHSVEQMSDDELARIAAIPAGSGAGVAAPANGKAKPH